MTKRKYIKYIWSINKLSRINAAIIDGKLIIETIMLKI